MQLGACWNIAGTAQGVDALDPALLTWQMENCRVIRLMCQRREGDFNPDDPIWVSPFTYRQVSDLSYKYRLRLLLCLDPSWGTSKNTYHKRPPELDVVKLERYFSGLLSFFQSQPHEPLYAGQFGNELNYAGWIERPRTWEKLAPWYHRIADAFFPMQSLFEEYFPGVPFALGGNSALTVGDGHNDPPSLLLWMGQMSGDFWLDWHPSRGDTPEEIRSRTRALRRETGKTVAIFEDVHQEARNLLDRAKAARDGGSPIWTGFLSWPEELQDWRSGVGISADVHGQPWDQGRANDFNAISQAFGRYRPGLVPRDVTPAPPPPSPPDQEREELRRIIRSSRRLLDDSVGPRLEALGVPNLISGAFPFGEDPMVARRLLNQQLVFLRDDEG
jgi:hypothetical protein